MENIEKCGNEEINKDENWETASKFLGMIFGISEEKRKELTEQVKRDYYINKDGEGRCQKKIMCDCWIGWFEEIDHSEWFTQKDLIRYIKDGKEYAEYFTAFNYCPLCGKKIDWKAIKGGANG